MYVSNASTVYKIKLNLTCLIFSKSLGCFNIAIVISTFPSDDLVSTDVFSTSTTQLAPGGIGAPVLIRAHSPSPISF